MKGTMEDLMEGSVSREIQQFTSNSPEVKDFFLCIETLAKSGKIEKDLDYRIIDEHFVFSPEAMRSAIHAFLERTLDFLTVLQYIEEESGIRPKRVIINKRSLRCYFYPTNRLTPSCRRALRILEKQDFIHEITLNPLQDEKTVEETLVETKIESEDIPKQIEYLKFVRYNAIKSMLQKVEKANLKDSANAILDITKSIEQLEHAEKNDPQADIEMPIDSNQQETLARRADKMKNK